jgi:membrane-associated phospholipid phosphatase
VTASARVERTVASRGSATGTGAAAAWLAIALLSLVGATVVTILAASHATFPFDAPLLSLAQGWPVSKDVWNALSEVGNYPMIPIGLGFVVWLAWKKRKREALLVLVILIIATVASEGIKAIVARPRPTGPVPGIPGVVYSYPSGHALEDPMVLGMVSVRLWRSAQPLLLRLGVALLSVAIVVLVATARVALNVHYPSDILGGLFMGLTCLGFYAWASRPGSWTDHPSQAS